MGTVFLRRLTRWQAETEREDIADLYVAALRGEPGQDRAAFLRALVDRDAQQPEFTMVVAGDPALAGAAWGHRADRGGAWWERFAEVPTEVAEQTARQVFVVAGLVVAPRRRREGLATRLQQQLLDRVRTVPALALVPPGNAPARAALQSWGWAKAGQLAPRGGEDTPLEAWLRSPGP
ncbi:GNAT family N-acetyltransferase [Streptomyces sp. DSM 44917]|uniref:GNAT family N-acetyltransferase n=1 Tax=Streptomyces boetiae TaxID=3075541 RepID=A0ABU2L9P4_9ACTN|nr:GNAT family N-acetyltransferase [Streptomyces sp. DSM 44917]MDT0308300.1 GNAT family N-acetyltransferase [Streptomyces sp. DSM 44917]